MDYQAAFGPYIRPTPGSIPPPSISISVGPYIRSDLKVTLAYDLPLTTTIEELYITVWMDLCQRQYDPLFTPDWAHNRENEDGQGYAFRLFLPAREMKSSTLPLLHHSAKDIDLEHYEHDDLLTSLLQGYERYPSLTLGLRLLMPAPGGILPVPGSLDTLRSRIDFTIPAPPAQKEFNDGTPPAPEQCNYPENSTGMVAGDRTPISILVASIKGLGLPKTTCLVYPACTSISDLYYTIMNIAFPVIPGDERRYWPNVTITTHSRRVVNPSSQDPISNLLSKVKHHSDAPIISLRMTPPTLGGKGGFGSQLRAAGGRMSSRKNRRNAQTVEEQNGSNRNLDGRRIRTITEAKNLATYLAMKPDMDKKEREEKRKRWEAIVEEAERKEDEMKRGKGSNIRLDGQWVEQKEEAENKTRDAVLAAMKAGLIGNDAAMLERTGSESSASPEDRDSDEVMEGEGSGSSSGGEEATASKPVPAAAAAAAAAAPASRTFFGWDEDDEDMSDEEDDEEDEEDDDKAEEPIPVAYEGKGKGRA